MAVEPIVEQLTTGIVQRLQSLKAGDQYWYDAEEVGTDWRNFDEVKGRRYYGVIEGPSTARRDAFPHAIEEQAFIIVVWIKDTSARRQVLRRTVGDLKRVLGLDPTWAGLALQTDPPDVVTDEAALVAAPFAYAELTLRVRYRRAITAA